eukprot:Skav234472  [mRNA]  locus=scaffold1647:283622:284288:+ [translate_table: standard]
MEADTTEHAAWDCSSVPSRADECLIAMCSLVKVPAVACMLPAPMTDETKQALGKISDAGVLAEKRWVLSDCAIEARVLTFVHCARLIKCS